MPFNIRSGVSQSRDIKVFVSKYSVDGNDSWFPLAPNFNDADKSHWQRNGWEVVVFKEGNVRRGWYIDCSNKIVDITFNGFSQDLGLVRR
ncbi:hypothetical protein CPB83DRAFT_855197 [Crepidotus variabilis]|uniref:Uncharacterized protein n=1 Tax=Crepidotus variabilis TaxID=179855 RepID=A0A9P6EFA7_9AGAR|nr:hypothetical protein CPB83DRAFT_855197 [Crepidotus variabilis]